MDQDSNKILSDLQMRMIRMEEQVKTLFKQQSNIEELTKTVHTLALSIEKQGMNLKSTCSKLDGVQADVDELKQKPAKRWETVVTGVISALVGAFMAYIITKGA